MDQQVATLHTGPQTSAKLLASKLELRDGSHGNSNLRDDTRTPILILVGATAMVLLIAMANAANLLLARSAQRRKELAIRAAIGAGRGELMGQLLTEAMLLAIGGALAGFAIASVTLTFLVSKMGDGDTPVQFLTTRLEWPVLLYGIGLALITGLICGFYPAWDAARTSAAATLKDAAGQASSGRGVSRARRGLVCAQLMISAALLIPTGLFLKSLVNLMRVDLGLKTERVVTFGISPEMNGYSFDACRALLARAESELAAIPGVAAVTDASVGLIAGDTSSNGVTIPGVKLPDTNAKVNEVGPGFFAAIGIPLIAGREFNESQSGDYFGGHYGPVSDFNQLQTYTLANLSSFLDGYKTAAAGYPNIFNTIERITAGYLMNTMDFGKLHIVAGVRIEGTQMNSLGYNVILYPAGSKNCPTATGCGTPVPVTNNPSYVDVLPSISLRYALDNSSGLRLVYARGVARPDVYQLVPYVTEDDSTNPATIALGNPNLKPEHANNYDLLYERYLNPAGILQAGFFAKQLSGTLISTSYTAASGPYQGDLVSQWLNVSNAELYGFEISYQQRLSFLPGVLGGLGMLGNYSWTGSKVFHIPGRTDSPQLQRQSPNTWNISPTFDRGRFSVRVGLSYNGPCIYQYEYQNSSDVSGLGPKGPSGDVWTLPHLQLDAQASVRLGHGLSLVVYGLNLTNEVFGYYTGSPIFVNQREFYKSDYAGGFRYNFNREK
jgi:TonB dependent receptor-like, beta-barrel/FtsX-like permease family